MLPTTVTRPAPAAVQSCPCCRSPGRLRDVASQFDVQTEARYRPRDTSGDGRADTHCDAYVGDVTRALGCEVPNWWDGRELSANGQIEWLAGTGRAYGWVQAGAHAAIGAANEGRPAVATWRNPAGSGHVAVCLPTPEGEEMRIAQAGRRCLWDVALSNGFGSHAPECVFFVHE
jgi:hypothetical protein